MTAIITLDCSGTRRATKHLPTAQRLGWLLWPAVVAGCAGQPLQPVASASPVASPDASDAAMDAAVEVDADDAAGGDAIAAAASGPRLHLVEGRGTRQGEPLAITVAYPSRDRASAHLVFVGDGDETRGAWWVEDAPSDRPPFAVQGWPVGVRVIDAVARGGVAYVLLETRAVLDQPAGVRSVAVVGRSTSLGIDTAESGAWVQGVAPGGLPVSSVVDRAGLEQLLERHEGIDGGERPAAMCAAFLRAARTPSGIPSVISARGLDLVTAYQPGVTSARHVAAADVARAPEIAALARMINDFGPSLRESCRTGEITDSGETPSRGTLLGEESGRLVVQTAFVPPPLPPEPATRSAPAIVAASATSVETERAARERIAESPELVRQAPLDATGNGTVGFVGSGPHEYLVVHEAGGDRLERLYDLFDSDTGEGRDVRFADLNGDGRTDVVVGIMLPTTAEDGTPAPLLYTRALIAGRPTVTAAAAYSMDESFNLAMVGAHDLDAAVQAALAAPRRGISVREACPLVHRAVTAVAARRVADANAVYVEFEEPDRPSRPSTVERIATATTPPPYGTAQAYSCAELTCRADRPFCRAYRHGGTVSGDYYWFRWRGAHPVLAGMAVYIGS